MSAQNEDFLFAQEAEKLGYISEQQVEEAFLLQRRMSEDLKIDERLAVILVKRGWIAEEQARRVYAIIEPKGASQQIEGYRLVAKIGRGAMGTVYKAIHERLNRPVAIKILRRDLAADKTQIERLKGEAQLLASLDHPNIVRAIDAGESNGFPYFVMEYVEGENLRDAIIRKGAFDEDEALRIARDLANALERARRMGVVHRDVKPGNVILTRRGGVPKLMDLGLAKGPIDLGLTQHGATVGTPQFISPEQAQDPREADTRSDIYSLGATLYAMLTSRPPFEGATLAEIITKVLYEQPTPLRVLNDDISPEVSYLVQRMMLKDPSLRYRTPAEVVEDIDRIKGGQSIVPQGFTGNWEAFLLRRRMTRWRRRGLIAVAALVLFGVGGFLWHRHAKQQESITIVANRERQVLSIPTQALERQLVFPGDTLLQRLEALRVEAATRSATAERARAETAALIGVIDEHERVARARGPQHDAVRARLARLAHLVSEYTSLQRLAERVLRHFRGDASSWSYGAAARDVEEAQIQRAEHPATPVLAALGALRQRLVRDSGSALSVALETASSRTRQSAFVLEFQKVWRACRDDLTSGRFVATTMLGETRAMLDQLLSAAELVRADVERLESDFETAAIMPRVNRGDVGPLVADFRQRAQDLERLAREQFDPYSEVRHVHVASDRLLGEGRAVTRAIDDVRAGIDAAVQARTAALIAQATKELERTPFDPDEVERLRDQLVVWRKAIEVNYRELADQADAARQNVADQHKQYFTDVNAYFADVLERAFNGLARRGEPAAVARLLNERIERRDPRWAPDPRLQQLGWAAEALADLQGRALRVLEKRLAAGRTRMDSVRLRDGMEDRWKILSVDTQGGVVQVDTRQGSRWVPRAVSIAEVHPDVLLSLVSNSLSPRLRAVARLSAMQRVQDEPGLDLRPFLADWRKAHEAFTELKEDAPVRPWVDFVTAEHEQLERWQGEREARAREVERRAAEFIDNGKWVEARLWLRRLRDPKERLRYTDVFDAALDQIDKNSAIVARELERDELLLLIPGAKLKTAEDGSLTVLFDFDTPEVQKQNIVHGLAEFERAAAGQGQATTPNQSSTPYQLHLLKGEKSLIYDRPLAFAQMFDPAKTITFEATINTVAGSFLLAVDIDGVKVAVCSADPRLFDRRFARDVPLLGDEKELPEYDFYGMGRGVAFHKAATRNFGSDFSSRIWTWPRAGRGRNFKAWRDPKKLNDPRKSLFAFDRGTTYRIKVVRDLGRLRLYVDGRIVAEMEHKPWERVGTYSDARSTEMRHGSGLIQLLTWTPLIVDDVALTGTLSRRWEADRRAQMEREAKAAEKKKEDK